MFPSIRYQSLIDRNCDSKWTSKWEESCEKKTEETKMSLVTLAATSGAPIPLKWVVQRSFWHSWSINNHRYWSIKHGVAPSTVPCRTICKCIALCYSTTVVRHTANNTVQEHSPGTVRMHPTSLSNAKAASTRPFGHQDKAASSSIAATQLVQYGKFAVQSSGVQWAFLSRKLSIWLSV